MTLEEFYTAVDGDLAGTMSRMAKEERVLRFLKRFPAMPDYADLMKNLEAQNYADAFRNVHTVKGNAMNLGLTALANAASDLCEEVRNGPPTIDITAMTEAVTREYNRAIENIEKL